ncbi:estrogen sulfotransferase [Biomphalaria glabrata]|nr:estrogen sulfotransferase-like [Biomphalaria glabrata]
MINMLFRSWHQSSCLFHQLRCLSRAPSVACHLKNACYNVSLSKQSHKLSVLFRNVSNTSKNFKDYNFDPKQATRRRTLLLFTYLSGFIGAMLLTAIGLRHYARMARRAQGIEDIKLRQYGRKPQLFRYRGYVFPDFVVNDIKNNLHFEVREDDVWVVSFPKSGTTWLQEIVYLINNGVDIEDAAQTNIEERFPYFEWIVPGKQVLNKMESPRLIKTHLPLSMLPNQMKSKKPKIIYIARNPKDTVVSYYFFLTKFVIDDQSFVGTFDDYCKLFVEGLVHYGPWWKHVKEAWDRKDEDNILVLFYEDLQEDVHRAVRDIANFLNKPLTESQVEAISRHCSFDTMKNNKAANYDWLKDVGMAKQEESFLRKGQVGDWRNHLKPEISDQLDEMVASHLEGVPIRDTLTSEDSTS